VKEAQARLRRISTEIETVSILTEERGKPDATSMVTRPTGKRAARSVGAGE
jgi:hypothetical protein